MAKARIVHYGFRPNGDVLISVVSGDRIETISIYLDHDLTKDELVSLLREHRKRRAVYEERFAAIAKLFRDGEELEI
mgnify:CR=1 FL=1